MQKRAKEGCKGWTVGLAHSQPPPLCACGGDLGDAPLQTSFVYKLVLAHEFVDIWDGNGLCMAIHIGATKNQGHFVVHVFFEDKWCLCDDTTAKGVSPPPNPRKATSCCTSASQPIRCYQTCHNVPSNEQGLVPFGTKGMPRACLMTPVCWPWRCHQVLLPPPGLMEHRVHQGLGAGTVTSKTSRQLVGQSHRYN